jgi:hypothetical protein
MGRRHRTGLAIMIVTIVTMVAVAGCDYLVPLLPTPEYVPQPIPTAASSRTGAEDRARFAEWDRRNLVEAYQRVGRRNPIWDEAALQFISRHELVEMWSSEELVPEGRRLVALGCDDPLVLYLVALDLWLTDMESGDATRLFKASLQGMKQVPYPRGVARFVVSGLRRDFGRRGNGAAQNNLAPLELAWFKEALTDGSYLPGDEVTLAAHLRWGSGQSLFERNPDAVATAVGANVGLAPWVRLLVSARRHLHKAYEARGGGYANSVTPEGWKGYDRELALARKDLTRAWRERPDRPEIAVAMMELVKSGNVRRGETVRRWFDRAVSAQIDYWAAYSTMLDHLRPRWSGSHEQMLAFARECVDTGRYDTAIPHALFQALDCIEEDEQESEHPVVSVYRRPGVFDLVSRVVDGYLGTAPTAMARREYQTRFVVAAHKAGRDAEACARAVAMDADLDRELSSSLDESPRRLTGHVCALAAAGETLSHAEGLADAGQREAALRDFQKALPAQSQPLARAYVRHRIAALRLEGELAKRGWVPFLPADPDLAGWQVQLGEWTVEPGGALRGRSPSRGMMIRSAARVGPDFEIRGEYELVETSDGAFQAGVIFGHPNPCCDDWLSMQIKRNPMEGEVAGVARRFYAAHTTVAVPVPDRGRFDLRCWRGHVSARVNGTVVEEDYEPPDGLASLGDGRVGLGSYDFENEYAVRYRKVELRRLDSATDPARATRVQ